MKYKKIRGHKRKHKQIEKWRLENTSINLTDYLLNIRDRYYTKIRVYPWNGFTHYRINSIIPQPRRKTKKLFLDALLDIYTDWKTELSKLGQPYYLKIWLYETDFSKSQVVCAIGENVNFYENTFTKPENPKFLNLDNYGILSQKMKRLQWKHYLEEDHYENNFVGELREYASEKDYYETKTWFNKLLKKPHQITTFEEQINGAYELYSFKKGNVWIGG